MKAYNELVELLTSPFTNSRYYQVNLPQGKNPEGIDITWYFDADVNCLKLDDGLYYAVSSGQGDPLYTTEILPPQPA